MRFFSPGAFVGHAWLNSFANTGKWFTSRDESSEEEAEEGSATRFGGGTSEKGKFEESAG